MSKFVKYKLKDGRVVRGRYDHDTDKVLISRDDLEGLLNESDVAYEQAKQLQTIIENLDEIRAEAVRKAIDKIRAEIEKIPTAPIATAYTAKHEALEIIDKYKAESEVEK